MTFAANERELLAQLLDVTVVRVDVDRALEEERLVEAVQLVLDGLRGSLGRELLAHGCFAAFQICSTAVLASVNARRYAPTARRPPGIDGVCAQRPNCFCPMASE